MTVHRRRTRTEMVSFLSDWAYPGVLRRQQAVCYPSVSCSVSQGSVLGPVQFISYSEDITAVFDKHCIKTPSLVHRRQTTAYFSDSY